MGKTQIVKETVKIDFFREVVQIKKTL